MADDMNFFRPAAGKIRQNGARRIVTGCTRHAPARMCAGGIPDVDWNRVYGVTTFELG